MRQLRRSHRRNHRQVRRDDPLALARFLPQRIAQLAATVQKLGERFFGGRSGLAADEWQVVAALGEGAPLSAAMLAQRTTVDQGRALRVAQGLARRGLVEREPDAFDARRISFRLSLKGRALYRRVAPRARAQERALLASLSLTERRVLLRLLEEIERQARALAAAASTSGED